MRREDDSAAMDTNARGYSGHRREGFPKQIEVESEGTKREIRDAKEPDVLGVACREQVLLF